MVYTVFENMEEILMTESAIHAWKQDGGIGNTRTLKKLTILKLLVDNELSCSELSKHLELSNSGVTGIVEELEGEGLVVRRDSEQTFKGRRPVVVGINPEGGLVVSVMLTSSSLINVADLSGKIIASYEQAPYAELGIEDVEFIKGKLRELLSAPACKGRRLLAVSIAAPGKINKHSGAFVYAPFVRDYENINLKEVFEREFGVPVVIRNMLHFAFIGEKRYGTLGDKIQDTLYVSSLGSALCLNGQIYDGHNGFAGELGLMTIDVNNEINDYFNRYKHNTLTSSCSTERLIKIIESELADGAESSLSEIYSQKGKVAIGDIISAFRAGDPLCAATITMHAKIMACVIRNLAEFLDLNSVVLAGMNMAFGEKYRSVVQSMLDDTYSHVTTKVFNASMDAGEAEIKGALYCAIDAGLSSAVK